MINLKRLEINIINNKSTCEILDKRMAQVKQILLKAKQDKSNG